MKRITSPSKVYVKSNNTYQKIINKYNISLILYLILSVLINIIIGNKNLSISLIKSSIVTFVIASITAYIINIIKKEHKITKLYTSDSIISISIILAIFGVNISIYILSIATIITLIIKNTIKKINISSSLYGILIILLYKYFNNEITFITNSILNNMLLKEVAVLGNGTINYLFSISNKVPILAIISFIYLFHHKSIKYNIVFSYIITFSVSVLLYGILKGFNIYYGLVEILTSSILFLTVYTISDYMITPTISEGNIIYGTILGIISFILSIYIHEIGIVITLIICPLVLTNIIEKMSPKLKYNNKLYYESLTILIIINLLLVYITAAFL